MTFTGSDHDGKREECGSKESESVGADGKEAKFVCHGGMGQTCNKEIKEDTCICCDVCNRWYHMLCQLKSSEEFDVIRKYKLFWVCSYCQIVVPSLFQKADSGLIDQVTGSLKEFRGLLVDQAGAVAGVASSSKDLCHIQNEAFSDLKRQLEEQASLIKACHLTCEERTKVMTDTTLRIEEKVERQESRGAAAVLSDQEQHKSYAEAVKSLGDRIDAMSAREVKTVFEPEAGVALVKTVGNLFDKEKRKYNIVVHNLPESVNQDSKTRNEKDVEAFKNLIKDEFHISANIGRAFRAGKIHQERPRPLIVSLAEEGTKWDILRLAPQLRDSERCRNVFLSPDRTPEEREADRKLRLEVKKLREEGKAVRIQRGKVVFLQPATVGSDGGVRAVEGESKE